MQQPSVDRKFIAMPSSKANSIADAWYAARELANTPQYSF